MQDTQNLNVVAPPASLACVAGTTHRALLTDSQDAASVAHTGDGMPAVMVADGMGDFAYAGETAQYLVEEAQRRLQSAAFPWHCLRSLYTELYTGLIGAARDREATLPEEGRVAQANQARSYGASLLMAREATDVIEIAYAGNGGITPF